jgi:hypothetical protein
MLLKVEQGASSCLASAEALVTERPQAHAGEITGQERMQGPLLNNSLS